MCLYDIAAIRKSWQFPTDEFGSDLMVSIDIGSVQKEFGILFRQHSPYNEQFVDEISKRITSHTFGSDLNDKFSDISLTCAKQLRTVLVKYAVQRIVDVGNLEDSQLSTLSRHEKSFRTSHLENVDRLRRSIYGNSIGMQSAPPKSLYVHVKVIKDCGTIQTEYRPIRMSVDSSHFIRRSLVQPLISQGFLTQIGSK